MMKYRIAIEKDFPQLAKMRWDFQIEDDAEKRVVEENEFLDKCAESKRKNFKKDDWTVFIAEEKGAIEHIFMGLYAARKIS